MMPPTTKNKNHFEQLTEHTNVCACEMEYEFKTFFGAEGTEFDVDGNLNILFGKTWVMATQEQVNSFIENYKLNGLSIKKI